MKTGIIIGLALVFLFLFLKAKSQNTNMSTTASSVYDIEMNSIDGHAIDLNAFKGKYILFVNVASKCGFTPQYKELQEISDFYQENLVVIGVPCNQFREQEPGAPEEIAAFCSKNYGVDFLITEKVDVKGENQHTLYKWLTTKASNGVNSTSVKWNFQKYLIGPEGNWVDYFMSTTKPNSDKIIKYLK